MRLCLAIPEVDTGLVLDTCTALARYNARTYRCSPGELCTRAPWGLRYDARAGDSSDGVVTMRDAVTLLRAGSGACGELSAAYAGWLIARGRRPEITVVMTGVDAWHVRVLDETWGIIDPAMPETLANFRGVQDGVR